jgi:ribonuclease E
MSTQPCPTCAGSGTIRSVESAALQALRAVEIEGMKGSHNNLTVTLPVPVALYLLNQKRDQVVSLEQRYDLKLEVQVSDQLIAGLFEITTAGGPLEVVQEKPPAEPKRKSSSKSRRRSSDDETAEDERPAVAAADGTPASGDEDGQRKRRRRRRRRRRSGESEEMSPQQEAGAETTDQAADEGQATPEQDAEPAVDQADAAATSDETTGAAADEGSRSGRRRRRSSSRGRRRSSSSRAASGTPQPTIEVNGNGGFEGGEIVTPPADAAAAPETAPSSLDNDVEETAADTQEAQVPQEAPVPADLVAGLAETAPATAIVAAPDAEPLNGEQQGEPVHHAGDDDHEAEADADLQQQAAIISEPAEPRRGWWNRFVRKSE